MKKTMFALAVASALTAHAAMAEDMVFTSWGGTTQDAQAANWAQPFTEKTGTGVMQDGPTDYGKIKAMVEAGAVTWDVVDAEFDWALQAGKQGLLEPLDFTVIDKAKLDPRFVSDYAVGSFYYSFVLGWNPANFSDAQPATLADLFDTTKFPGKRTFYKWSAPGVIEAALLADGVAPDALYPLDLDRAFAKLDTIKSDIIWWEGGAQSQQLLASGEAPIGFFWNGRLAALQADGMPVGISWDQNITAADALVVPKGTAHKDAAMKFIAEATSAEGQAAFAAATGYAPVNLGSADLMDPAVRATLPDAQTAVQVNADMAYWAEHRDEIGNRWYAWQAQ
ncbi:MAG: ABC transporter substrate-binding protein [Rhodobacterales bacterium 65-51]|jgi:putative spermidine/putrescine transport system substrate-binding protein|uniref:ABC transporter substrate-binding protein n=1 Tax=uncultured Gemmobacter sp. TaxID=1095917 RepID=UPI00095C3470|nr:ABC transporter substrate-binding protein [uncultured Gemmobacter sp.]OJY28246.1 MAG: ABC transporter substrate-binding protein [Rhodobacterales bacterium 65-51]